MITSEIEGHLEKQSWIRRMFEAAAELKAQHGEDNVFDFSLGNPDLPAPPAMAAALRELADQADKPRFFGYVPNAGLPSLRAKLAERVAREQNVSMDSSQIIVTCGAAGAINALFRAILNPGDEVLCPAPYFVEYGFYAGNYKGVLKTVPTTDTFDPDLERMAEAISPRTRAVLINSPNNPTGRVYSAEVLAGLADLLRQKSREFGHPILLVSDEPYRFLVYDNVEVPPVLSQYEASVVISSFSKSLSLAGARIGYLAVHPDMPERDKLLAGITMTNRVLGYVNAPIIAQRLVEKILDCGVDTTIYDERRHAMAALLEEAGLQYVMPEGAFYFFPRCPNGWDDQQFAAELLKHNVIAVPGSGFGRANHLRLTYCVDGSIIRSARGSIFRAVEAAT